MNAVRTRDPALRRHPVYGWRRILKGGVWGLWHAELEPWGRTWCGLPLKSSAPDHTYDRPPREVCERCVRALDDDAPLLTRDRRILPLAPGTRVRITGGRWQGRVGTVTASRPGAVSVVDLDGKGGARPRRIRTRCVAEVPGP